LIRDLNLVRKLILAVEAVPTGYVQDEIEISGYSKEQIGYHAYLLVDAGLANGIDVTTIADTSPKWIILHLTSAGHDFADAARDESIWHKATGVAKEKAGSVTLDVMKHILIQIINKTLGFEN
jgi:hypothetical protein